MVEKETPVSVEVTQSLAMRVWMVSLFPSLSESRGLGRLVFNAHKIKVDGVIKPIFQRDDNDSVIRHFLFNCDVNAKKEAD